MPEWIVSEADRLAVVAGKAVLMYLVVLAGLRIAHRRTLSQWTAMDFAAAVAVGALLGRTAVAEGQSFAVGAVALVTILGAHAVVTLGRFSRLFAKAVDHRVRVLVDHGVLRRDQMRLCGLTDNDVLAKLRQAGVGDVSELRYVLYETKGELTIIREPGPDVPDPALVADGLRTAASYRRD